MRELRKIAHSQGILDVKNYQRWIGSLTKVMFSLNTIKAYAKLI